MVSILPSHLLLLCSTFVRVGMIASSNMHVLCFCVALEPPDSSVTGMYGRRSLLYLTRANDSYHVQSRFKCLALDVQHPPSLNTTVNKLVPQLHNSSNGGTRWAHLCHDCWVSCFPCPLLLFWIVHPLLGQWPLSWQVPLAVPIVSPLWANLFFVCFSDYNLPPAQWLSDSYFKHGHSHIPPPLPEHHRVHLQASQEFKKAGSILVPPANIFASIPAAPLVERHILFVCTLICTKCSREIKLAIVVLLAFLVSSGKTTTRN